jgi:hypothetical protein
MRRYAMRVDDTQREIVNGLRKLGVGVWIVGRPVDLLLFYKRRWQPMEIKTTHYKRPDQAEQNQFCADYEIPRVTNLSEAMQALGIEYRGELP